MQYDPFRLARDLGLTWPEVKLWPWPFKVIVYMVRRALTRQTRWYQNRCSTFKNKDFIFEKPFWKILEFWPLETSILTWAKKWPKWFRNDFSRAFERCLSFFSTATRSRDHGGGGVQTPPPPAGGGKSRGPAGRGLIPVRPEQWCLPCFKWDNNLYFDTRSFGSRSSPRTFNDFADCLMWLFRQHAGNPSIQHHLDDYDLAANSKAMAATSYSTVLYLSHALGIPLAAEKCVPPTTRLPLLGSGNRHRQHDHRTPSRQNYRNSKRTSRSAKTFKSLKAGTAVGHR